MLTGKPPFYSANKTEILKNTRRSSVLAGKLKVSRFYVNWAIWAKRPEGTKVVQKCCLKVIVKNIDIQNLISNSFRNSII